MSVAMMPPRHHSTVMSNRQNLISRIAPDRLQEHLVVALHNHRRRQTQTAGSSLETWRLSREGMNHWRFPSTYLNPGLMKRGREDLRPARTGLLLDLLASAVR
jgi:hypothetical protein